MTHRAKVRLEVESRPESLALVRRVLVAFADPAAVDGELLGDIETAVSEACNNVVLHAYTAPPGPMIVSLEATETTIEARVEDRGAGFRKASAVRPSSGIGLPVISALADYAEFRSVDGSGTHVRMQFSTRRTRKVSSRRAVDPEHPRSATAPRVP
jgi:serine/threonine-protein kinase RsbW